MASSDVLDVPFLDLAASGIEIHRHFVYFVVRIYGSDVTNFNHEKCYDIFRI